jgi:uncharacterized protein YdhG (YjbR/CyaY superfamily)
VGATPEQAAHERGFIMKSESTPPRTIDEYIAGFPADVQRILQEMRSTIRTTAPDAEEAIKYRMPTFVLNCNLVHFAAFDKHIGFYPTSSGIANFKDELSRYHIGKGSVQFPLDQPVPFRLIRRIVAFRVKEACGKPAPRSRRTKRK